MKVGRVASRAATSACKSAWGAALGPVFGIFRRRRAIISLGLALAIPFAVRADNKPDITKITAAPVTIESTAIANFNREGHDGPDPLGKLEFRGGLVLKAPQNANFGGWSGLVMDDEGKRLLAISDSGVWLTGQLDYRDGRPSGISDAVLGPLKAADGGAAQKAARSRRRGREPRKRLFAIGRGPGDVRAEHPYRALPRFT